MDKPTDDLLDPAEIESLMHSTGGIPSPGSEATRPGKPDYKSEIDGLSAELASTIAPEWELSRRLAEARPFELPSLDAAGDTHLRVDSAEDGAADSELQFELGRAELSPQEAEALREGAVVSLDKLADDPIDIVMDGRLIARGEVFVLDDRFCVRVSEILALPCADPSAELVH